MPSNLHFKCFCYLHYVEEIINCLYALKNVPISIFDECTTTYSATSETLSLPGVGTFVNKIHVMPLFMNIMVHTFLLTLYVVVHIMEVLFFNKMVFTTNICVVYLPLGKKTINNKIYTCRDVFNTIFSYKTPLKRECVCVYEVYVSIERWIAK